MSQLLLHSLTFYAPLLEQLAAIPGNPDIVEVGSESGEVSELLAAWAGRRHGRLTVVEPFPSDKLRQLAADRPNVSIVAGYSPAALAEVPVAGMYVVDGDHNYATVRAELAAIFGAGCERDAVAVMHDVGWPCGRRDTYYDPTRLSPDDVRPHSWDEGAVLDNAGLAPAGHGFRGEGSFAIARQEGGPRNGVLTAVEDTLAEQPDLAMLLTPLVFGLAVVGDTRSGAWDAVVEAMRPYTSNPTLDAMERNRLELYLHVLALQDAAAGSPGRLRHLVAASPVLRRAR